MSKKKKLNLKFLFIKCFKINHAVRIWGKVDKESGAIQPQHIKTPQNPKIHISTLLLPTIHTPLLTPFQDSRHSRWRRLLVYHPSSPRGYTLLLPPSSPSTVKNSTGVGSSSLPPQEEENRRSSWRRSSAKRG